ncbi:MAG: glucose-6-phosphate dehydrogenase [Deltaproteobacteria bacterium]|nr:glucose-6-phosphate dehydrogenase [Deltaproteobacteria bacterium]
MPQLKAHLKINKNFCIEEKPGDTILVVFGASGDLTERKIIPALFNLYQKKLLPKKFFVLACARTKLDDISFRDQIKSSLMQTNYQGTQDVLTVFCNLFFYLSGDYHDPRTYADLSLLLDKTGKKNCNLLFYLATPPVVYDPIVENLGKAGLVKDCHEGIFYPRVVVEKPFGHDLSSALELNAKLRDILAERQIYRIDHYLGKETVQNILMFRFANTIFEPVWNRQYIDHVQITVAEDIGVGHRAGYYDKAGHLRDIFQNHMFEMMALVAMEPPASFEADRIRDQKTEFFRSIRPVQLTDIVRAQYKEGIIKNTVVPSYRQEQGVPPDSVTETFVAAKLWVDSWRWHDVPFFLKTGKRLAKGFSEIAIKFKHVPHSIFGPIHSVDMPSNELVFNVQPNEGIALTIQAKYPGPKLCMSTLTMDLFYKDVMETEMPSPYERLLIDCMLGDQTLFIRQDEIELEWGLVDPILKSWELEPSVRELKFYPAGSWGPAEADELIGSEGRCWHRQN